MTTGVSNMATIQGIYEAFGRGDVPFIISQMAEDVAWEDFADNSATKAGVPWLVGGTGIPAVAAFFQVVGAWQPNSFEVKALFDGGNKVVAEIEADFNIGGGKRFADQELHMWTLNAEGKVSAFRHYVDTAKHIAVAQS
ncbi:MAG: nuclear transport factor 2 family protein [Dehalococcoidia bacterium]|nr:nuclear transport factor 2 family protein [Dehalococcoidia bacterium]MCB9486381.1 nuclear transport factor 2 family protein [Thermoflexaceae bacterium]